MKIDDDLTIEIDGVRRVVSRTSYVSLKLKELQAFGYTTLSRDVVEDQLDAVLSGGKLTVIGYLMEGEVISAAGQKD